MSTILMYHYIGAPSAADDPHGALWVPAEEFAAQMAGLEGLRRRSVLGPEFSSRLRHRQLKGCVWITFDDGKIDNYEVALPILKQHHHVATFFVTVEPCLRGEAGYMPLSALKELVAEGMEVGSHTLTHPKLARLGPEDLRREVADSRARLEDALGVAVTSFCYPYGNRSPAVEQAVRDAGYELATSTIRDNTNREADRYALRRVMIQPGRLGMKFRYVFSPLYHWVHARKNARRWKE